MISRFVTSAVRLFEAFVRLRIDLGKMVWCLLIFRNYLWVEGRDLKSGCRSKIVLGPGNDFNDPLCTVMDMTPDRLFAHLKSGWAEEVATSSPHGIKNTSIAASVF